MQTMVDAHRRQKVMAARREIRSLFPGEVIEAMVDVDGRVSFERRPPIDASEADLRMAEAAQRQRAHEAERLSEIQWELQQRLSNT